MTEVEKLLKSKNYDIRISNDARFMDQKCTPDVVCIIADCVMNLRESEPQKEFTVQDICDILTYHSILDSKCCHSDIVII